MADYNEVLRSVVVRQLENEGYNKEEVINIVEACNAGDFAKVDELIANFNSKRTKELLEKWKNNAVTFPSKDGYITIPIRTTRKEDS